MPIIRTCCTSWLVHVMVWLLALTVLSATRPGYDEVDAIEASDGFAIGTATIQESSASIGLFENKSCGNATCSYKPTLKQLQRLLKAGLFDKQPGWPPSKRKVMGNSSYEIYLRVGRLSGNDGFQIFATSERKRPMHFRSQTTPLEDDMLRVTKNGESPPMYGQNVNEDSTDVIMWGHGSSLWFRATLKPPDCRESDIVIDAWLIRFDFDYDNVHEYQWRPHFPLSAKEQKAADDRRAEDEARERQRRERQLIKDLVDKLTRESSDGRLWQPEVEHEIRYGSLDPGSDLKALVTYFLEESDWDAEVAENTIRERAQKISRLLEAFKNPDDYQKALDNEIRYGYLKDGSGLFDLVSFVLQDCNYDVDLAQQVIRANGKTGSATYHAERRSTRQRKKRRSMINKVETNLKAASPDGSLWKPELDNEIRCGFLRPGSDLKALVAFVLEGSEWDAAAAENTITKRSKEIMKMFEKFENKPVSEYSSALRHEIEFGYLNVDAGLLDLVGFVLQDCNYNVSLAERVIKATDSSQVARFNKGRTSSQERIRNRDSIVSMRESPPIALRQDRPHVGSVS